MATELKHVSGLSQLTKNLLELPTRLRRKVMVPATAAAAAPIRDQAIMRAPVYHGEVSAGHPPPGTLKASIYSTPVTRYWTPMKVVFVVRVRSRVAAVGPKTTQRAFDPTTGKRSLIRYTYRQQAGGAYYWWWVEFGSAHNSPAHFMRDALYEKSDAAINAFADVARAKLPEVIQEMRK